MKFRPCIDLHEGKVKQIVGSTLSDKQADTIKVNFASSHSAAYYAQLYKQDQLSGGHVIMLGGGNDAAALAALEAYPQGLQIGGGINCDNAIQWLKAGASHVILTTFIFSDGKLNLQNLKKIHSLIGRKQLVLDLSCRKKNNKYFIVTNRWQKFTDLEVNAATLENLAEYCDEFLIHAVDVEGKQAGIDSQLLTILGQHCPIKATYAGGIRNINDIQFVAKFGDGKIDFTVGSALDIFGGSLPYKSLLDYSR